MRTPIIALILSTVISGTAISQNYDDSVKTEIENYFFGLPTDVSLDSLDHILSNNKNFKRGRSNTYNPHITIDGKILQDKNLNINADYNQFLVSIWGDRNLASDTLRFGWYISYGLDELKLAIKNRDDLKAKFMPLFSELSENTREGLHGEMNESVMLRTGNKELEIRLTKYERPGKHRVSITYTEIRERKTAYNKM